jgi:maleate isomerase
VHDREYGALATLGIAVPQANPTVEPEMAALAPDRVTTLVTRLRGSRVSSNNRLVEYLDNLAESLDAFDTARLDAVGFACTGTSYLIGRDEEERRFADLSRRFGYPIVSAAQSIREALDTVGARKIALFAPYPKWLIEASQDYWRACGYVIQDTATVPLDTSDTRNVYQVSSRTLLECISQLETADADAVLLTGTGMPTLRAIPLIAARTGKPVLSSNLCLAWSLLRRLGAAESLPPASAGEPLFGGWSQRLRA